MVNALMKRLATAAVTGAVVVSTFECSLASSGKRIIRVSHTQPEVHSEHLEMLAFKEYVGKRLGDKYEVRIFFNEVLGSAQKAIELTQAEAIDFVIAGMANLETFADVHGIFSMPYLLDSREVYRSVMEDTDHMENTYRSMDGAGFRAVTWYNVGTRNLYAKTPIDTSNDLKGRKIRVQQSSTSIDMVNAFGVAATLMGFGEVCTAIQQGVIDGAENNELALTNNRHGEVAEYYTYNKHQVVPGMLVVNSKFLNGLSSEELMILKGAAALSTEMGLVEWDRSIEEIEQIAINDMDIASIDTDVEAFRVKILSLHQKVLENNSKAQDLYRCIQTANDLMRGGA